MIVTCILWANSVYYFPLNVQDCVSFVRDPRIGLVMKIDLSGLKKILSQFATGVTVVTTEHENQKFGLTVNAFCSLSLDPPLVLICLNKKLTWHKALQDSGRFPINILTAAQEYYSNTFANPTIPQDERFASVPLKVDQTGAPIFTDAMGHIDCSLHEFHEGGDHLIYIGEVKGFGAGNEEAGPLLYFNGRYDALAREEVTV